MMRGNLVDLLDMAGLYQCGSSAAIDAWAFTQAPGSIVKLPISNPIGGQL
jgi:hypothetical protein